MAACREADGFLWIIRDTLHRDCGERWVAVGGVKYELSRQQRSDGRASCVTTMPSAAAGVPGVAS